MTRASRTERYRTVPFDRDVLRFVQSSPLQIVGFVELYKNVTIGQSVTKRQRFTRTFPFIRVHKPTVARVGAGDCGEDSGDEATCGRISSLALSLVNEKL